MVFFNEINKRAWVGLGRFAQWSKAKRFFEYDIWPCHTLKILTVFLGVWFLAPQILQAEQILLYYNSFDGTEGAILQCASILRSEGDEVTVLDVKGAQYDPTRDNWGPPYDQVWDLRFVDRNSKICGSGKPSAADYFGERWRSKALSYLAHCGRLFIEGENYELVDRDEGLYAFLREVGAVDSRFDACPPSVNGNSITDGTDYYPVRNGLGPVSFFGAWVGGIPLRDLTGTSFVETGRGWKGNDQVGRSIASGWEASQLPGLTGAPACARGKLFVLWDASMWPLWRVQMETDQGRKDSRAARAATRKFFPAIARWLGEGNCPCGSPPVLDRTRGNQAVEFSTLGGGKASGTPTPALSNGELANSWGPSGSDSKAQSLVFYKPPVNIYVRFADGPGRYRLEILARNSPVRILLEKEVGASTEEWVPWDGLNQEGLSLGPGNYEAVLYKEGRILKKIILSWVSPAPEK